LLRCQLRVDRHKRYRISFGHIGKDIHEQLDCRGRCLC
jgi:hypothetical protein